jgi:CNT family concentrative nucleoside transporter
MGVPWDDCVEVGRLLGEKIVLTEFVAYINLGALSSAATPVITERSAVIASYGLCGFANFASIGIQLGGIGGLAPSRMGDLAELGLRAPRPRDARLAPATLPPWWARIDALVAAT